MRFFVWPSQYLLGGRVHNNDRQQIPRYMRLNTGHQVIHPYAEIIFSLCRRTYLNLQAPELRRIKDVLGQHDCGQLLSSKSCCLVHECGVSSRYNLLMVSMLQTKRKGDEVSWCCVFKKMLNQIWESARTLTFSLPNHSTWG